jgi:hypothetical protein
MLKLKTHDTSFTKAGPITLRPLPKISGPRAQRKRKSVGTVLLTSTPYKDNLTEEKKQKAAKEETRKNKKGKCNPKKSKKAPPKKLAESSSEEWKMVHSVFIVLNSIEILSKAKGGYNAHGVINGPMTLVQE